MNRNNHSAFETLHFSEDTIFKLWMKPNKWLSIHTFPFAHACLESCISNGLLPFDMQWQYGSGRAYHACFELYFSGVNSQTVGVDIEKQPKQLHFMNFPNKLSLSSKSYLGKQIHFQFESTEPDVWETKQTKIVLVRGKRGCSIPLQLLPNFMLIRMRR